jgi:hypothetical protein
MPPAAKLRPLIEEMIHDGKTPREIAARAEDLGMSGDYALQIYRGLTSLGSRDSVAINDHGKHLRALYEANGYGFGWWPPSLMERVYLLEQAPAAGRPFWNAA